MIKQLKKIVMCVILVTIIVLLNGCEDTTTTTEVFPDGSCKRTVVVKSNSGEIFKYGYPLPTDSSWTVKKKWEEVEGDRTFGSGKQFVYTAEKRFREVSRLNRELAQTSGDPLKIRVEVKLEKRFAWFFTYFTYREIYKQFFPFKQVPYNGYFSPDELRMLKFRLADEEKSEEIYPKETLEKIEEKFEAWYGRCIFEEFHQVVLAGAKKLKDSQLTPAFIDSQKEALYKATLYSYQLLDEVPLNQMLKKYEEILKNPDVLKIREQNEEAFSQFEEKFQGMDNVLLDEFTNIITMPGLITDTNAKTVTGNRVTWDFGTGDFLISDYEMWVTSRRVNWWMVGIAGFILLVIIVLLAAAALARHGRTK